LSNLRIKRRILGFPIYFDLGIDYTPKVPFEESINQVGASLEDIPSQMRALEVHIEATDANLETVSQDIVTTSERLHVINSSIADFAPLLDDYVRIVAETNAMIRQTRTELSRQLDTAKLVVTIAMAWIGSTQIAPLYLGCGLLASRRKRG